MSLPEHQLWQSTWHAQAKWAQVAVQCLRTKHVDTYMSPAANVPGDKPEAVHPAAAAELADMGHGSTLEYVAEAAGAVLAQTGLLPHVNAGVASETDLARLRRVSASQARACWLAHAYLCRVPKIGLCNGACNLWGISERCAAVIADVVNNTPAEPGCSLLGLHVFFCVYTYALLM